MSNLIVSRRCNQTCSYCFAGDELSGSGSAVQYPDYISIADFDQRLDYLDRSGITQARFLGGEPTLHPRFAELVRLAAARSKTIVVFSNGWMPKSALEALEELPVEQCGVVMNITTTGPAADRPAGLRRRQKVLQRLGAKAQPGCNLYQKDQDLDFIIRLIMESGCKRAVRIGLAQPILTGNNTFLSPKDYRLVGQRITQFAQRAAQEAIKIELDCGFVRCMFSEEDLAHLQTLGADLGWRCSPIIDIDVDGKAFHCFPLANKVWANLSQTDTAASLRETFEQQTAPYRQAGIYRECSNCPHKLNQSCSGGCLANTIRRFSNQTFHLTQASLS